MAVTSQRNAVRRRLEEWRRHGDNWRLKGLLLAVSNAADPETVGRVWPRQRPQSRGDYVNLGLRHDDTHEYNVARELYEKDAITSAELVPRDEYIARALTSTAGQELDVLWREHIHDAVIDGATTRRIARDATTVTPVSAKRGDLAAHEQTPFADADHDGSGAEFDSEDYTQVSYNCTKFSEGFAISEELIDQTEVDLIERKMQAAGEAVENAINRQLLTNVIDNAGQNHDTAGNDANPIDLFEAAENVADNDFDPVDSWIIHPEFRTEVADEGGFAGVNWTGAGTVDQDHGVYGVRVFIGSDSTYNGLSGEAFATSNTWGWEAGSEIGAVVFGSPFVHTVLYRDIEITELTEPITAVQDIQGGVASAWSDSVQPDNNAISTITQ